MNRCVKTDRWDRRDLAEMARGVPSFAQAREQLRAEGDVADALDDVFFLLLKADPRIVALTEVAPSHRANHTLVTEVAEFAATRQLRRLTVGDPFRAAVACAEISQLLRRACLARPTMKSLATLRKDLAQLASELAATSSVERAWSFDSDPRMSVRDRLILGRTLDTQRMKAIADLFGRIQTSTTSCDVASEELADVTFGDDIGRVLPSELMLLGNPVGQYSFFAKWSDHELLEYVSRSEESEPGGIVVCIDGSHSMAGEREHWAKALLLVLLNLARQQDRPIHVIHFGAPHEWDIFDFTTPESFSTEAAIAAARIFYDGATDYEAPMMLAQRIVRADAAQGRNRFDVVFVSDDECAVAPDIMDNYLHTTHATEACTWAISVSDEPLSPQGAMHQMSDGHVLSLSDLRTDRGVANFLTRVRSDEPCRA